jgi:hypothetical protein
VVVTYVFAVFPSNVFRADDTAPMFPNACPFAVKTAVRPSGSCFVFSPTASSALIAAPFRVLTRTSFASGVAAIAARTSCNPWTAASRSSFTSVLISDGAPSSVLT